MANLVEFGDEILVLPVDPAAAEILVPDLVTIGAEIPEGDTLKIRVVVDVAFAIAAAILSNALPALGA